ncbi:MAG: xanthine dehydrogenase family protein subunit M [Chloroflexi bacterium]|nr:xanthine dehydrogenase family protein subunit M [Chloroflexota bacterium]
MYPPKFDYYRAGSIEEAIALAGTHDGRFLAGGHSLLPVMKMRLANPETVIDIGRIEGLSGISKSDGRYQIGALTNHAAVAAHKDHNFPVALSEAAGMIGDPQVRNRGTVGGNVAHADPASDLPTVFLALNATFHISGSDGLRSVHAANFFTGLFETALAEGEMVTAVEIPAESAEMGSAYTKLFNPASRYAMVGACANITVGLKGECTACSVTVGGLTSKATAVPSVGAALVGKKLNEANIHAAARAVLNDLGDDVMGDIHASADYRRQMAPIFVARSLVLAAQRAGWVAKLEKQVKDVADEVLKEIERKLRSHK